MYQGTFSQPRFVADLGRGKHDKKVTSVTFIHGAYHELLLVCAGEEGSIQIWNASTLELVDHHKKHKSTEVMAISSKDDNVIVGGDRNGVLSVWTRSTYDKGLPLLRTFSCSIDDSGHIGLHVPIPGDCHDEEIHAVTWRPNNATADAKPVLASSSRDKRIRLWEGTTALNDQGGNASMLHEWTLPRPKKAVSSHQMGRLWLTCCWVPSSNFSVVCSSITGDLFRLEWTPKQKKVTAPTTFKHNHTRLVFNIAPLVIAYNKVLLLSISMDRDVRLTDAMSMECHAKLTGLGGHVYALSYNSKKALVAGGVGDNTIRLVDLAKSTTELLWKGLQSKVTAVAWNPLGSCAVDGVVYASNPDAPDGNSIAMNKRWGVPQVTCMAWLGGMAALGTPEGAVVVVKRQGLTAWTRVHTFYDHTKAVTAVAWCATSSQLATASNDATICVYALDGGVVSPLRHCLTGHGGGITCLDWSPSGVYLASASVDSTIQVWKVGRSEGYNFREHSGRVLAVTWVDDATLASGGDDQSIRKWTFADLVRRPFPSYLS
ncbi:hypothetical protein DYB26_005791 [Aphanomyces astaci]|uniref:Anaphase-promoting complex subunit 4 WD40 domain-containing protein n=3 Tax=Aphanomyces astaci TaxID=112090 RepID=A0A3R7B4K8_APHAT|nr:hypothetical protein DYB26_005791 [Aphanomyces astaci]